MAGMWFTIPGPGPQVDKVLPEHVYWVFWVFVQVCGIMRRGR